MAVCFVLSAVIFSCDKANTNILEENDDEDTPTVVETDELLISSLAGSAANGATLIINGHNFGTKTQAAPVKYDDFEGGTSGQVPGNGWDYTANAGTGHKSPHYSNTVVRPNSNLSMQCRFDGEGYLSSFGLKNKFGTEDEFFVSAWYYYNAPFPRSRNHKVFHFHVGADGSPNAYVNIYCADYTNIFGQDQVAAGTGKYVSWGSGTGWGSKYTENKWTHLQFWVKHSSAAGIGDGKFRLWVDGKIANSIDSIRTIGTGQTKWNTLWLGNYLGHGAGDGLDCPASGDAFTYWENVYIDTTPQRVILANKRDWTTATNFETQVPSSWADNQISVKVNKASFASSDSVFVFVVDKNNKISPAFPLP